MMDLRVQAVKKRAAPECGADVHILLKWIRRNLGSGNGIVELRVAKHALLARRKRPAHA